jgi:hypothetical protein
MEILFLFSLKRKRLECKAGLWFAEMHKPLLRQFTIARVALKKFYVIMESEKKISWLSLLKFTLN